MLEYSVSGCIDLSSVIQFTEYFSIFVFRNLDSGCDIKPDIGSIQRTIKVMQLNQDMRFWYYLYRQVA